MKNFICSKCKNNSFLIYGSNIICSKCRYLIVGIEEEEFENLLYLKIIEVKNE